MCLVLKGDGLSLHWETLNNLLTKVKSRCFIIFENFYWASIRQLQKPILKTIAILFSATCLWSPFECFQKTLNSVVIGVHVISVAIFLGCQVFVVTLLFSATCLWSPFLNVFWRSWTVLYCGWGSCYQCRHFVWLPRVCGRHFVWCHVFVVAILNVCGISWTVLWLGFMWSWLPFCLAAKCLLSPF